MRVVLEGGTIVEGTSEQVTDVLNKLGITVAGKFYNSSSKGLIAIDSMSPIHLKNAILKIYGEWLDTLRREEPEIVIQSLEEGIQDKTWIALVEELIKKVG